LNDAVADLEELTHFRSAQKKKKKLRLIFRGAFAFVVVVCGTLGESAMVSTGIATGIHIAIWREIQEPETNSARDFLSVMGLRRVFYL